MRRTSMTILAIALLVASGACAEEAPAAPQKAGEWIAKIRTRRDAMAKRRAEELKARGEQWVRQRFGLLSEPLGGRQLEPQEQRPEGISAEQVNYLIESLAESLTQPDLILLELSLQGLRAAGQDQNQLLKSVEDANCEATLRNVWARVRIDVWTLAARAWAGEARARLRLKSWAGARLIDEGTKIEEVDITSDRAVAEAWRKADALLALAFLKDEVAGELARRVLDQDLSVIAFKGPQEWRFNLGWGMWGAPQADRASRVLLMIGGERGELIARIQDPQKKPAHRALLTWGLAEALRDDGPEAAQVLVKPYQALLQPWLKTITENVAYTERFVMLGPLDALPPHKEGLEALQKVRETMAEPFRPFMDGEVNTYRRRLGVTDEPVKPPTPPEEPAF